MEIRNYNKINFYALDLMRYMGKVMNVLCISAVLFMLSGCPSEPGANAGAANPELFGVWKALSEDDGSGIELYPFDLMIFYYPLSLDTDGDGYKEADLNPGDGLNENEEFFSNTWMEITETQIINHGQFTVRKVDDTPLLASSYGFIDGITYFLLAIESVNSITDTIVNTHIEPVSYVVTGDILTWITDDGTDTMVYQKVDPSEIAGSIGL